MTILTKYFHYCLILTAQEKLTSVANGTRTLARVLWKKHLISDPYYSHFPFFDLLHKDHSVYVFLCNNSLYWKRPHFNVATFGSHLLGISDTARF